MTTFIDTHCHLTLPPLCEETEAVLRRAEAAGVTELVVPAYDLASWPQVAALAAHPGLHPAFGLHPWYADEALSIDELRRVLQTPSVVALGEVGLDFKLGHFDAGRQKAVLGAQLELACELDLPLLLHCRGAFPELLELLRPYGGRLRGLLHAYSRGPETLRPFLDLGLYVAFGGGLTRPAARQAHKSAVFAPADRLLLETDAPSIGMDGLEPKEVEPAHIPRVAQSLAALRGTSQEEIALVTGRNARSLFGARHFDRRY